MKELKNVIVALFITQIQSTDINTITYNQRIDFNLIEQ